MLSEKAGMNVVHHPLGNLTFSHSIYLHRSSVIFREACSDIFLIFPYLLLFIVSILMRRNKSNKNKCSEDESASFEK